MIWLALNAIGSAALAIANPILAIQFWEEGKSLRALLLVLCGLGSALASLGYAMRIAGA
ncbi:MAG: hypothetical protein J7521_20245 [Caulobacter sp.]|nr:hypothetical protein [Caulobacter sp.]